MAIILYRETYPLNKSIEQYMDMLHASQLKYLASDLFQKGMSSEETTKALARAMHVAETAGLEIKEHFLPVCTQGAEGLYNDCKLSKLGLELLLLNGDPNSSIVAEFQVSLLKQIT